MRAVTVFFLVLAAFVASSYGKPKVRLEIKVLEHENVDDILSAIIEATQYAFETGLTAEGRMTLLENQLKLNLSSYNWFVAEGASSVAHTSEVYAYLKVLDGLIPHTVQIVAC